MKWMNGSAVPVRSVIEPRRIHAVIVLIRMTAVPVRPGHQRAKGQAAERAKDFEFCSHEDKKFTVTANTIRAPSAIRNAPSICRTSRMISASSSRFFWLTVMVSEKTRSTDLMAQNNSMIRMISHGKPRPDSS